jgi:transposase-like protein
LHEAKEVVLAFRHFPKDHWRKIWSTNLLERVNTKQPLGQRQLRLSLLVEDGEPVVETS